MHALKPSSQAIVNNNGIYNLPCCIPRSSHSWSDQSPVKSPCYEESLLYIVMRILWDAVAFGFTSGSSFTASARCCHAGILVMRKYTEKRNADGYTVILSVSNPSPSNIYSLMESRPGGSNGTVSVVFYLFIIIIDTYTK